MSGSRLASPLSAAITLRWSALVILAFTVGALVLALTGYARETDRVREEIRLLAAGAAVDVDRYVQSQFTTLAALAASDDIRSLDPVRMEDFLDRSNPSRLGFDGGLFWVDTAGVMRARGEYDGPPLDFSERDYVQVVLSSGRPYVGSARMGQVNRAPLVALAIPTRDPAGAVTGVLAGAFRLDRDRPGADNLRFAGATSVEIVDRGGHVVVGPTTVEGLLRADPGFDTARLGRAGAGVLSDAVSPFGATGRLIGFATAEAADWMVIVDRSMGEAFGPARTILAIQIVLIAIACAGAVAATLFAARRVAEAERRQAEALAAERQASTRLEAAVAQLEEREVLRDAFVGVLSHELRTPVTSIYGAAKLLAKTPDRADRDTLVEDIEDESDRLYRMIEDLLVLSRAERGRLEVNVEPVLVQRIVPAIEGDLRRRFPTISFRLELPESLPPVAAEAGPLRQVLNNLLTNAAKYGGGTPVMLRAEHGGHAVRVVVEDGGPGFTEDEAAHLFDLFYRAPASSKLAAGTGIGLYVVRQLVEALGGTVGAERRPGGGARFIVTLRVFDDPAD